MKLLKMDIKWTTRIIQRIPSLLLILAAQALYFPINRGMHGGIAVQVPLDNLIPLIPIWSVPYAAVYALWGAALLWALFRAEDREFRACTIACLVTILTGMATFVLFPTYVNRPVIPGTDWASQFLRSIYTNDAVYNAFPSGHVYLTTLVGLFFSRWYPQTRMLWVVVWIIVTLSTLFTHQHSSIDPIGGLVWGYTGYRIGLWWNFQHNLSLFHKE